MISFTDDCRQANIIPQVITYPISNVDEESFLTYPAFLDSLDEAGSYTAGICGEKRMALADGSPEYLSIVTSSGSSSPAGDLALSTFNLVYNNLLADENDAGQHVINYTVSFYQYADVMPSTSGSFAFEIENTCSKTQLVEHQTINDFYKIRIQEPRIMSYRYQAYSDEISDKAGKSGQCGDIVYSLVDLDGEVVESQDTMVKIKNFQGATSFYIQLDMSGWTEIGTFNLILLVYLVDYPEILPMEQSFAVSVVPINEFVPPEEIFAVEDQGFEQIVHIKVVEPFDKEKQDILADEIRALAKPITMDGPRPVIKKMTQTGIIEVRFSKTLADISEEIDLTTLKYEVEPGVMKPVLEVIIEPSDEQDTDNLKMTWEVTELSEMRLVIQVYYDTPLQVSYLKPDYAVVHFADTDLWISKFGIQIPPEYRKLRRALMRQLPLHAIDV